MLQKQGEDAAITHHLEKQRLNNRMVNRKKKSRVVEKGCVWL